MHSKRKTCVCGRPLTNGLGCTGHHVKYKKMIWASEGELAKSA